MEAWIKGYERREKNGNLRTKEHLMEGEVAMSATIINGARRLIASLDEDGDVLVEVWDGEKRTASFTL